MLSLHAGKRLLRLVRLAVKEGRVIEQEVDLKDKRGVFVSIYSWPKKELRGCIGFIQSDLPLWKCVQKAALAAAFEDPRFSPLQKQELSKITFEISILEKPEPVKFTNISEFLEKVEIGKDGLILQHPPFSGLFLPQVWFHFKDAREFLENLAYKAGLTPDYVWHGETKFLKFGVQVFAEEKPEGKIVELREYRRD